MEIFLQLFLSALLGGLLGLEREYKRKEAGLRTYALVCLGAALFTVVGQKMADIDLGRVIQAVATGIGFIGAGLIIHRDKFVEGLTTAAGLWVAAAIGIAVGMELYSVSLFVTFMTIAILAALRFFEDKFFHKTS